ncbi:MAG: CRTAC1 family protein [Rhodothermales bacterium]
MRRNGIAWLIFCGLTLTGWFGCTRSDTSQPQEPTPTVLAPPAFTDVTVEAGLGEFRHETGAFGEKWFPETMGAGGGFFDYDGDGWLDLLLVGGGVWPGQDDRAFPALQLYRNEGDGSFTNHTEQAGLSALTTYGFGVALADYDNDGDPDIFVSSLFENLLLRNDDGRFVEVGREAWVAGDAVWSSSAIFFDADLDGWLDLYVGNYVAWSEENDVWCTLDGETKSYCTPELYQGEAGRFYHNNGDGTFADRTETLGFGEAPGKTLGVAEWDYNRDGWPDLVVVNDTQRDLLYENQGDGTFVERGILSGIAFDENGRARAGMGVDVGVVDTTGEASVFVGNFAKEMIGVYRHVGQGLFIDRAAISKIGQPSLLTLSFGLFLFDVNLDGNLDLFVANGHISEEVEQVEEGIRYRQPAQLFLNRGDGTFQHGPQEGVWSEPMVARGAAYADYDRDGDLDILIMENGGTAHLWRNDLEDGRFLRVRLQGRQSNPDGIGARIVAVVGDQRFERRARTGSSYLSQSEIIATFGLGDAERVDSVVVYWPGGQVDRFSGLAANQQLLIEEGTGRWVQEPLNGPGTGPDQAVPQSQAMGGRMR